VTSVLVEVIHPKYGFGRYKIKIIKKYNLVADAIKPKLISKCPGEISRVYIGRNVRTEDVKKYLINYFREKNMLEAVTKIKILT